MAPPGLAHLKDCSQHGSPLPCAYHTHGSPSRISLSCVTLAENSTRRFRDHLTLTVWPLPHCRALTFRSALQVILQTLPEGDRPGKVVAQKVLDGIQKRRALQAAAAIGESTAAAGGAAVGRCAGECHPGAPNEELERSLWCDFVRAVLGREAGESPTADAEGGSSPWGEDDRRRGAETVRAKPRAQSSLFLAAALHVNRRFSVETTATRVHRN